MVAEENIAPKIEDIKHISMLNENIYSCKIELCDTCNWRCEHCYNDGHSNIGLTKNKIFSVLEELRDLGCYEITYTGGEIFTRSDAMEIIEKTRKMGFEVILLTNISLLTYEMINKLSEVHITNISATIFSMDEDVHDSITSVKGSLKKVLENIRQIKEFNIPLDVKTPVMIKNSSNLEVITNYCDKNDIKHYINLDIYETRNGNQAPLKFEIDFNRKKELMRYADGLKGYVPSLKEKDSYFCEKIRFSLMIQVDGNVCVCPQYPHSFGNVNHDSIHSIWYGSDELTRLRNVKWGDITECWSCKDKKFCNRCAQYASSYNEAIFSKNSKDCMLTALNKEVYAT